MKKVLSLMVAVLLCFVFAGCADIATNDGGSTATETTTEDTYGLNETAELKTLKFTATEVKESDGDDFFTPEDGNVFVGVNFTIENISDEEQSVSSILLFEAYADDVKCDYSINAQCAFDNGTLDGSIAPGKKMVGWYAIEVPSDWEEIEFDVQSDWLSSKNARFVFKK